MLCGWGSIVVFGLNVVRVFGFVLYRIWKYVLGFLICNRFGDRLCLIWYWKWNVWCGLIDIVYCIDYVDVFGSCVVLCWCLGEEVWF